MIHDASENNEHYNDFAPPVLLPWVSASLNAVKCLHCDDWTSVSGLLHTPRFYLQLSTVLRKCTSLLNISSMSSATSNSTSFC